MEKKQIGSLEVTAVGIGCNNFGWRIDAQGAAAVVDAAFDAGVNFFDTADIYGEGRSEEFLGRALAKRRNQAVIATKFGMKMDEQNMGARPEYVVRAVEASLRRLATDSIDLYQLHRPDATVPIADTLGALDRLVRAGKIREIGCSNFSAGQILEAEQAARGGARFVSVQNEYSLINREPEAQVLPECVRLGMAFLPYFPLANGLLTGKYRLGEPLPAGTRGRDAWGPKVFTERNLQVVESLIQFAEPRGHTLLELAISWLGQRPAVASVIAGAKSPEQVRANAAAAGWKMSGAEFEEIDRIVLPPA
jgi:aryl-alcohol dehydrogenase-like predicted oxidoreductase